MGFRALVSAKDGRITMFPRFHAGIADALAAGAIPKQWLLTGSVSNSVPTPASGRTDPVGGRDRSMVK